MWSNRRRLLNVAINSHRRLTSQSPGYLFGALILIWCAHVFALDPSVDIAQYAHKTWKTRDGFPLDAIDSIAQTPNGYLWLGTRSGLLRFDGVTHVDRSPLTAPLPSATILALAAGRDGSLWIGTERGLAQLKDGKLTEYGELSGYVVANIIVDHEGTIWVGATSATGRVCSIRELYVRCGEDRSLSRAPISLYEDSQSNWWIGLQTGLSRWSPERSKVYPIPGQDSAVLSLLEHKPGTMLVGTSHGLFRYADGGWEAQTEADRRMGNIFRLLRDRDGGLWIGTSHGLFHVHEGRTDSYSRSDGLSGDVVTSLYEDIEGDVWVGTLDGLDQFRSFAIPTISPQQGLSAPPQSVLAGSDGSIWVATGKGLNRLKDGNITDYSIGSHLHPARNGAHGVSEDALPEDVAASLATDNEGRVWVAGPRRIRFFDNRRFGPVVDLTGGWVNAIASDQLGSLWVSNTNGLIHILGSRIIERAGWDKFGSGDFATSLLSDPSPGGLWLGFFKGGVAHVEHNQLRAYYDQTGGLGSGAVWSLYRDEQGALWAATEGGLSRLSNGRFKTLSVSEGLPCSKIHWVIQDDLHSFWLGTACGVLRIDQHDLEGWASGTIRKIHATVFDRSDGVRSYGRPSGATPRVAKSADGKLWFTQLDGLGVIDPHHLVSNPVPPPVQIEQIIADHETYAAVSRLTLPPRRRDVQINYTALSLVAPEKVMFRYKLEGHDRDWESVGNRRQAYYNDLPPGNYRFRVIASNNSGVWNETGAALDFSIAPAYWQTAWFRALCVAALLALLWTLYRLRMRQLAHEFEVKLEARVEERARIARELHDTLLQSFNGLLLRFRTVHALLSKSPDQARTILENTIDETRQALTEGRKAVQGLRPSAVETHELLEAIKTLTEELANDPTRSGGAEVRLTVEGTPRRKRPLIRDEIYRIASEALRNAFRHAAASRIEVQLSYNEKSFEVRVRDDGKGIDPKLLADEGPPGHFGMRGMRERAQQIGGKLTVWSAPGSGTELVLSVPAVRAYAASSVPWRSRITAKFSGSERRSGSEQPPESDRNGPE